MTAPLAEVIEEGRRLPEQVGLVLTGKEFMALYTAAFPEFLGLRAAKKWEGAALARAQRKMAALMDKHHLWEPLK